VQAALTGHLVLSTIHTNDSIGVIPRLVDMGIDPYLIAPTLILAMAQRLVGLSCPGANKVLPVEGSVKLMIDKQFEDLPKEYKDKITFPKEVLTISPTPECPKGIKGRVAVFEVFKMNPKLENIILTKPTDTEIRTVLRSAGMLSLREDAMLKAFRKEIPFEEVNKL